MNNKASQGFSLLELMIVLLILGLLATAMTYQMRGSEPRDLIEKETKKFAAMLHIAQEEAVIQNLELGMVFEDQQYYFVSLNNGKWQVFEQDFLNKTTLPEEVEIQLALEGTVAEAYEKQKRDASLFEESSLFESDGFFSNSQENTVAKKRTDNNNEVSDRNNRDAGEQQIELADGKQKDKKKIIPSVLILSSGEMTPFIVGFIHVDEVELYSTVSADLMGKITVDGPNNEALLTLQYETPEELQEYGDWFDE